MGMDRAHPEKAGKQHHKTGAEVESTREAEEREAKKHLAPGL